MLPLLVYWPLTIRGRVLYWGVPLYQFYPWHTLVVEAIRSGQLPLWTEFFGNGAPLLANHQSATFYPLNLIYFVTSVERAMGYSVVLHLILAGLFGFGWGRTIGLSRFGATVVGLSFALSGFLVSRTQFITIINGAIWLPLLFLLAERLARRRTLLDAVWLGVAIALQFLAGHAQLWFYSLWVVVAYVLARSWSLRLESTRAGYLKSAQTWRQWGRVFALLTGALILSLGLSAVQLLPTAELSHHSQRAGGMDPDEAMTYSFWPWRLLTLAIPDLFGSPATGDYWGYATYWEDTGYVGLMTLLLALGAVLGRGRRWLRRRTKDVEYAEPQPQNTGGDLAGFVVPFFIVLILVSLILAMGQNTPVYPFVFKYIPGFGAFRSPARFLLFYAFALSTLAGAGAHRFRLTYRIQYVARLTVAGAGAILAVSLAMGQLDLPIKSSFGPAFSRFAVLLGGSAILVLLGPAKPGLDPAKSGLGGRASGKADPRVARSPLPVGVWRGLVICFIAVDLLLFAAPLTPTIDAALYSTLTDADRFLLARADDDRLFATYDYDYNTKFNGYLDFSDWGSSELAYWLSFRETLVPNLNFFSRSLSVNYDEPLVVGRWRDFADALRAAAWPDRLRLLRMANVGYVLAESPPPDLSPVPSVSSLYRLSDPLPRVWAVSNVRVIADPNDLLSELMAVDFDPTSEVLLEPPSSSGLFSHLSWWIEIRDVDHPLSSPRLTSHPQTSPVPISLREGGNSRTIDLTLEQPAYLVLAYTYYPGWRATVDGQPAEILRANYAFMALPLQAGKHQVVLNYRPVSLTLGALITGLSALTIIAVVVIARRSLGWGL